MPKPPVPVLRAPSFPGIAPDVARVSITRAAVRHREPPEDRRSDDLLIQAIRTARVGGSFWAPAPRLPDGPLTVLRPASVQDSHDMLADALAEAEPSHLVVSLPVAGWARRARSMLQGRDVTILTGDVDPWSLLRPDTLVLAHGDDEYVLLAQIAGVRVRVRSAGRFAPGHARRLPTIADRVRAEVVEATAYRDPFTRSPADAAAVVAILAGWRRTIDANRGIAVAVGMARWKRREIDRLLWVGRPRALAFPRTATAAVGIARRAGGGIAVWPSRSPRGLEDAAGDIPLYRVEDGFIRSVGLGAACVPPLSITVDKTGIHYDPSRSSDLEHLLAHAAFDAALRQRADDLIRFVVDHGIGKYGVDGGSTAPGEGVRQRRRILVPGQVEDDLSVRLGGADVAGNLDLLRRARSAEPDAEIWYRPHPDVDAGLRAGAVRDDDALSFADAVTREGSMASLLARVDALHVLTSLAGFEALLRGLDVTVHGQPFYAGWGLTRDLGPPLSRRGRRLTLSELVAGALILYPRYLDPMTGLPCEVERMTERLTLPMIKGSSLLTRFRGLQGRLSRWRAGE